MKNLEKERLGQISKNKYGSVMKIVKYINNNDLWVQFDKGKPIHTAWKPFCKGEVKSPYDKSVYGVGYIGEGKYKPLENGKITPQYKSWQGMLERCYSYKYYIKRKTYKDCTVVDDWHNFQNFAAWYDQNYYEIPDEEMTLDKDILIKRNKVYSPETCIFVPERINTLFTKSDAVRGSLPIGVHWYKRSQKYKSQCNTRKGKIHLGYFNTPEEAFQAYKIYKEKYIKEVANNYKDTIPVKLYNAMLSYIVEITD